MNRLTKTAGLAVLGLVLLPLAALASGGGGASGAVPQGAPSMHSQSPEALATQLYNRALHYRNKAWKMEEKAGGAPEEMDAKTRAKVQSQFEKMINALETAVEKNPNFYQAYSSLGYALRRTGEYDKSLVAYDRSLELNPNYAEAIEYRAEAFLALGRPDDARDAYHRLRLMDADKAAELLDAFEEWVERRKADPGGLAMDEIAGIAEWVAGQRTLASTTAKSAIGAGGSWASQNSRGSR